ncbi:MAG: Crp/Fnr family transcriptional regulator [Bacilli bacterium]
MGSFDEDSLMASARLTDLFHTFGTLRTYPKQAMIFLAGDDPDHVYLVASGLVKVAISTVDGRDITFFLRNTGDVFGFSEILLHQCRQRQAQTLKTSSLWALPRSLFMRLIDTDPPLVVALLRIATLRLLKTQETVEALVGHSVAWRLGRFLLQETRETADGLAVDYLHVTHAEIAQIIGASRQSVTEQLNRWISLGVIRFSGKTLIIVQPDILTNHP